MQSQGSSLPAAAGKPGATALGNNPAHSGGAEVEMTQKLPRKTPPRTLTRGDQKRCARTSSRLCETNGAGDGDPTSDDTKEFLLFLVLRGIAVCGNRNQSCH